jgi:hypothetical protein
MQNIGGQVGTAFDARACSSVPDERQSADQARGQHHNGASPPI